jgi:anti-anti-sigma regulatory factor
VDGLPFAVVVPVGPEAGPQLRWTLWTGARQGQGDGAFVEGRVLDVSSQLHEAVSSQIAGHLAVALSARQTIDLAKGALMLAYGLDADAAFELLVFCSQRTNTRVNDLAQRVTDLLGGDHAALGSNPARDALEGALVPGARRAAGEVSSSSLSRGGLSMRESSAGGASVLAVSGPVHLATTPALASALTRLLDGLAAGDVLLVDLSGVDHLGPAGVWLLEAMARRARSGGVELRLVAAGQARGALAEVGIAAGDVG